MRGKGGAGDLPCRGARGTLSGGQCEGAPCLSLFPNGVGWLCTRRQVLYPMSKNRDNLSNNRRDALLIAQVMKALDVKYRLAEKMAQEPGLKDIIQQFIGRIEHAFGSLAHVKGRRILDIACGSNTSKAPESFFVNTPFGERTIRIADTSAYTAQFEPWFCRILLELGADAVGVDIGDLEGEAFDHYYGDLGASGALDFLPSHSFDAIQDSRLFGSPEFTAVFPERSQRLTVSEEMKKQEQRLLKKKGIIIHSDIPHPLDPKAGGQ